MYKLRPTLLLLATAIIVSSCSALDRSSPAEKQRKYFPDQVEGAYLGMPRAELLKQRPQVEFSDDGMNFREVFIEEFDFRPYESIVYYVDMDEPYPVYEFIINYPKNVNVKDIARKKYGVPNHNGDEWLFTDYKDFDIHIWVHNQKIVVVGLIPGTEWYEAKDDQ